MEAINKTDPAQAAEKLAAELADVRASIALVSGGVATRITLTGMRFGHQVADRLAGAAALRGVAIETSFWPEDSICDIQVSLVPGRPLGPRPLDFVASEDVDLD